MRGRSGKRTITVRILENGEMHNLRAIGEAVAQQMKARGGLSKNEKK